MYPWSAGERITAEKLTSGAQYGVAWVELDTATPINSGLYSSDFYRGRYDIVFDTPFVTTPIIQVTARSSVPGGTLIEATYTDQSPNGFTIVIARDTGTTTAVDWLAIGTPDL